MMNVHRTNINLSKSCSDWRRNHFHQYFESTLLISVDFHALLPSEAAHENESKISSLCLVVTVGDQ